MITDNERYKQLVHSTTKKSPIVKDCIKAFLFGGGICCFGQALKTLYGLTSLNEKEIRLAVSVTLIVITAILTGSGVFDKIAKHAGAGTAVPITGFANAVVSPAIEFKAEGFILGMAAKMFVIAGPVIVYGTVASVIYGVIYWVTTLL
ncbi:MAG: stage V sporulation protein AC [Clostridia bacterium]|nr:stage V sporulation protein AC [Clostridia bacterium]MBP3560574.1 stage V sporulation protein AC [Clostridia bacterium]